MAEEPFYYDGPMYQHKRIGVASQTSGAVSILLEMYKEPLFLGADPEIEKIGIGFENKKAVLSWLKQIEKMLDP